MSILPKTLVFATQNRHKLQEVQSILGDKFLLKSLADIDFFEDIDEDYDTLEANASQKSFFIFNNFGVDCFADDTGLEVEALNGEPGVYSARYAGSQRSSGANIEKLLLNLKGKSNRLAQFRTVVSLVLSGLEYRFEGVVKGAIIEKPKGSVGFGYDPVFVPLGYNQTFAQMDPILKNRISHRALAINKLTSFLLKK